MKNLSAKDIRRIVFNIFSFPVSAIIVILVFWWIGENYQPHSNSADAALGDLGWGLAIIFLTMIVCGILFIIWNIVVIVTIGTYQDQKRKGLQYTHGLILSYPYITALTIYLWVVIGGNSKNNAINSALVPTTYTYTEFSGKDERLLTHATVHDSTFIITGNVVYQRLAKTEAVVEFLPSGVYHTPDAMPYTSLQPGSIKYYLCSNKLCPYKDMPDIYMCSDTSSLWQFFQRQPGINYYEKRRNFYDPLDQSTEHPIKAFIGDSINFYANHNINNHNLYITDTHGKTLDYYKPLEGFYGANYNTVCYDRSDKSVYVLVTPEYYKPDKPLKDEMDNTIYIARFNKQSKVYKIKSIRNQYPYRYMDVKQIFVAAGKLWVITMQEVYCINLV